MKGLNVDLSNFGEQFLEQMTSDIETVLKQTGLTARQNLKLSTFIKLIDEEIKKREIDE